MFIDVCALTSHAIDLHHQRNCQRRSRAAFRLNLFVQTRAAQPREKSLPAMNKDNGKGAVDYYDFSQSG
jgi:hypothetical protein